MSKLPKAPLEFNLSRKRNHQPISTKSTTITTQLNTIDDGLNLGMNETEDPQVGDRVLVEGKQLYGTLRYLGPTEFKPGKWAGVELDHQGTGKNDGSVQGVYYFNCTPKTGIFVLYSKIILVSQCLATLSNKTMTTSNKPSVNTSSLSLSSASSITSISRSSSSAPYPSPQTPTLIKKPHLSKNSQRTVNVTPSGSEPKHVDPLFQQRYEKNRTDDLETRYRILLDQHQQQVNSYQVKLGREQHRVYELRKERDHLIQQLAQANQQITQHDQLYQRVQQLDETNRQQAVHLNQLETTLEHTLSIHRKESTQLLEQQSQLIQELQRERQEHDSIKTTMRQIEQVCQGLMDPFDVRPGLGLVDQLKETQRQVKDVLEKVRMDTDVKNQQRRDINALHRDVANLESLIETKLFKQADLMESVELERQRNRQLKLKLDKVKPRKRGKYHSSSIINNNNNNNNNSNINKKKHTLSLDSGMILGSWATRKTIISSNSSIFGDDDDDDDEEEDDDDDDDLPTYCEICEEVGHDLMSCLRTDPADKHKVTYNKAPHMDTPLLQQRMLPSI